MVSRTDSMGLARLRSKIDSIMPLMGFKLLPDDSVVTTEAYKEISETVRAPMRYNSASTSELPAKGFGFISTSGLGGLNYLKEYFKIPANPDLVIGSYTEFDINHSNDIISKANRVNIYCSVFI
jgi:hypothetical protein